MFVERKNELQSLSNQYIKSQESSVATIIKGRRLTGKSSLALEFAKDKKSLYFSFSRKTELSLCKEILEVIRLTFNIRSGKEIYELSDVLKMLLIYAKTNNIVIVFDNFSLLPTKIASTLLFIWNNLKDDSKAHLILITDELSDITTIDHNTIELTPFKISELKSILQENSVFSKELVFYYYIITSGNPRYVNLLIKNKCFTLDEIKDLIFSEDSIFLYDTKEMLIEVFGKEYATYFAILELISSGVDSRSEIEATLGRDIGGYTNKLVNDYNLISKQKPFNAIENSRIQKLHILNSSITFWFKFIHKYNSIVDSKNFTLAKEMFTLEFVDYCQSHLPNFFKTLLNETNKYSVVGSYWQRTGKRSIDIVAVNENKKKILIAKTEIIKDNINMAQLKKETKFIVNDYLDYHFEYMGFGIR